MTIRALELMDFRNYDSLTIAFDKGVNILYGDNAQGKTNVLEAVFLSCTTKSHKGSKDKEVIRFDRDEAHIRTVIDKEGASYRVDMHLRKNKPKGIALDGQKMKTASGFLKKLSANLIFFSPEDLGIIKNGPSGRRRFLDMELCQLNYSYMEALSAYGKALQQRAAVLKDMSGRITPGNISSADEMMLSVYDDELIKNGSAVIEERKRFIKELSDTIEDIHSRLTNGREKLKLIYEPDVDTGGYKEKMEDNRTRDIFTRQTNCGPHRDDLSFLVTSLGRETDIRTYGSQGQQRTAALSLKLAEIGIVKRLTGRNPVLLLDDVLSELDKERQDCLLDSIGEIQTIITCTGLDEFVDHRFEVDKVFYVEQGTVTEKN